jgi:hypothetical protein
MNAMGDAVGGAHHLISLDVAELIEQARRATGLSDFGAFDGDWQARLESLVSNMEETARLNVVGRLMIREELQRSLCTRLFLAKRWTDAPAIANEEITAPIVITGPGRSGTSILFELMSLDPAGRSPLGWEAAHPGHPNPDTRALSRMTECEQEFWEDVNPVIGTIHEHRADIPVECVTLQLPSFSGAYWWIVANIPKWVPDMPASMAFHKAVLQTLQHGGASATWILKTPVYLMMIELLFATYPDAWVVRTHRDPAKTAPSGLSTMAAVRFQRSDAVDLASLGIPQGGGDGSGGTHDQMLAVEAKRRAGEVPNRFIDVHFSEVMRDPVAAVGAAYEQMGRHFHDGHAKAIRAYIEAKPRGHQGRHEYSPEDWGFDMAALREKARPYIDYFGVTREI